MNRETQIFDRNREQEILDEEYYERYGEEDEDVWRLEDLED